jgi:hypothetical protein
MPGIAVDGLPRKVVKTSFISRVGRQESIIRIIILEEDVSLRFRGSFVRTLEVFHWGRVSLLHNLRVSAL